MMEIGLPSEGVELDADTTSAGAAVFAVILAVSVPLAIRQYNRT